MTDARGIAAAGAIALAMAGTHAVYSAWPLTHGSEIIVPAALIQVAGNENIVAVRLPLAWTAASTGRNARRRLAGRPLYFQLTPDQPLWPGGPPAMRAAGVAERAIDGAINLSAVITSVRDDGSARLGFGFAPLAVPREIAARARPPEVPGSPGGAATSTQPATDPGVGAVLHVLPSGRAVLVGIFVNGSRY